MSVIHALPASVLLWHFVALGFVGNGVITVMINSPGDRQTMTQITRAEIIAHSPLIHQSSDCSARFFEFLQSGQPYARTDHNQRPAVKPRYCCNGRLPDGYHHDCHCAPRSSICCNATASTFGEKSFRPSCLRVGILHQRGKEAIASAPC